MTAASFSRLLKQKAIGALGLMSNQATAEYDRLLNEGLNRHFGDWDNAEIVVVSANFGNIEHFVRSGLWAEAQDYLRDKADRLERTGADVSVCVSNTMHRVVAPIMAERSTPFIHIADPAGIWAAEVHAGDVITVDPGEVHDRRAALKAVGRVLREHGSCRASRSPSGAHRQSRQGAGRSWRWCPRA